MQGSSLYDVITVVILAAAIMFYFIIPAANDAVDVVKKAKDAKTKTNNEEKPE